MLFRSLQQQVPAIVPSASARIIRSPPRTTGPGYERVTYHYDTRCDHQYSPQQQGAVDILGPYPVRSLKWDSHPAPATTRSMGDPRAVVPQSPIVSHHSSRTISSHHTGRNGGGTYHQMGGSVQGVNRPRASILGGGSRLEEDRKSTRLNSSHSGESRMPSSA